MLAPLGNTLVPKVGGVVGQQVTVARLVQLLNALFPMLVTVEAMEAEVRFGHCLNALPQILVTPFPMTTLVMDE